MLKGIRAARVRVVTAAALGALLAPAAFGSSGAIAAPPLPPHVFAPYFETWTDDSLSTTARQSGARFFTLAFLETLGKTSCTLAWNGDRGQTLSTGRYLSDIASLRAMGGDVIPSFGGWSADQGGTEIGDSCKDVSSIASAYKAVVRTYDVTRLDMDIEGRSLTKPEGIDRRNRALALLQAWASTTGRTLELQYTLPTSADGLEPSGLAVLRNAIAHDVRVDVVNPMVFDYYDRVTTDMGAAAITASKGLHAQLSRLYPSRTSERLWAMQGATIMNGLDDYPRRTEVTDLDDARRLLDFARAKGMSTISMWAIQRDNGGCPGTTGANDCSGIVQDTWAFSHLLQHFTGS